MRINSTQKRLEAWLALFSATTLFITATLAAAPAVPEKTARGDRMFADYFRAEAAKLESHCLAGVNTLEDWKARRERYRTELLDMLGLWPLPERTELKPVITGKLEHALFTVEKLQFQSSPGLYVTGDLYIPKGLTKPAPTILYVCGHGGVKKNGISYGNKVSYQHHGEWFARNGYVCLIIDTIQLGELEGIHHGTYREGMWWWNSRGYTPAGVEVWNNMRALDYLSARPEVDAHRFGITGRSGGGGYSWYTSAVDERIQVAVPVAGMTDLHNQVVDGCVEGHCDCMFMLNAYRWDFPTVAALIAPRPLLLSNTDKDSLFPLDGVMRFHDKVANIYRLYNATNNFAVLITEGPHQDTQDLQVAAFRWFNRFLKHEDPIIEMAAVKFFEPEQLKVFETLPADQRTTKIHETFVPLAPPPSVPENAAAWSASREAWLNGLLDKSFRGWPEGRGALNLQKAFSAEQKGVRLAAYDFLSQQSMELRLYVLQGAAGHKPEKVVLQVLSAEEWSPWLSALRVGFADQLKEESEAIPPPALDENGWVAWQKRLTTEKVVLAFIAPRGIGLTATNPDARKQTHLRRRFMLLGQTLDSMRVWDIRRAIQTVRSIKELSGLPLWLKARDAMAVNGLYAALFEPKLARLDLWKLPESHRVGPDYLNVLRVLDVPQTVALAVERTSVHLHETSPQAWSYPASVAKALDWETDKFKVESAGN